MGADASEQRALDLAARRIAVVQDAALVWPPSRARSKSPSRRSARRVELDAVLAERVDRVGAALDHESTRLSVAESGARVERVFDVGVEGVFRRPYRGDAALGPVGGRVARPRFVMIATSPASATRSA